MTYRKLIGAVPAFQRLVIQELPLPVAYKLSKMVKAVNEETKFFGEKHAAIMRRHEDPHSPKIVEEVEELLDLEIEWDKKPLRVEITEGLHLSCADVDALDGFIEFVEKEDDTNEQNH